MSEAEQRGGYAEQQQSRYSSPAATFSQSILQLTDPKNLLTDIEYNLRQAKYNPLTDQHEFNEENMLLNEIGIRNILSIVQSTITQNTVMSNLDNREVQSLMKNLIYTLTQQMMLFRRTWGIKNSEDRTRILQCILSPAFLCLKRPFQEGERFFWKGAIAENVVHSQKDTGGGEGWWHSINPFRRR